MPFSKPRFFCKQKSSAIMRFFVQISVAILLDYQGVSILGYKIEVESNRIERISNTVKSLLVPASTIFSGHFFGQFYLVKFGYYSRVGYYSRAGTNRDIMVLDIYYVQFRTKKPCRICKVFLGDKENTFQIYLRFLKGICNSRHMQLWH